MKKHPKNKKTASFTLIELITAMAIFSVLMVVMMRFFHEAQQAWTKSNQRSMVYDNARVALDLITRDLQCAVYEQDRIPFWHRDSMRTSGWLASNYEKHFNETVYFVSATTILPNDNCTSSICEISYQLFYYDSIVANVSGEGWLMRSATGNMTSGGSTNDRWNYYDNFDVGPQGDYAFTARTDNTSTPSAGGISNDDYQKVIPYVTNLIFHCYRAIDTNADGEIDSMQEVLPDGTSTTYVLNAAGHDNPFPYMVKVEISLLDKDSWKKWKAMGGESHDIYWDHAGGVLVDNDPQKVFRKKYERTFSKIIFLGERGQ